MAQFADVEWLVVRSLLSKPYTADGCGLGQSNIRFIIGKSYSISFMTELVTCGLHNFILRTNESLSTTSNLEYIVLN